MSMNRLTFAERDKFAKGFAETIGYEIPRYYFSFQNVWVDYCPMCNEYHAGFALIKNNCPRTLKQIPIPSIIRKYEGKVTELTGFFIKKKDNYIRFMLRFAFEVIKDRNWLYIYAYDKENKSLEKYYSVAKPYRIYSGKPDALPGHPTDLSDENIEVATKIGILRIIAQRCWKHATRKYLFRKRWK